MLTKIPYCIKLKKKTIEYPLSLTVVGVLLLKELMIIACSGNSCSKWTARCFVEDRVETATIVCHFEKCTVLSLKIKVVRTKSIRNSF